MPSPAAKPAAPPAVMSLELAVTIGLPILSIVVGSVMAFIAYADGFTEIAAVTPAAVVAPR